MTKIVIVVGTRPEYIKAHPIVYQLRKSGCDFQIINTGQHYDEEMSEIFLKELNYPSIINLNVGSGTHGIQTAKIIIGVEKELLKYKPDLVIVVGDTNSVLGASLASAKLGIPVAHVEAGCRVFDRGIPEEINRKVVDGLSSLLFAPSRTCVYNLRKENQMGTIHFTGQTLYDVLLRYLPKITKVDTLNRLNIDYDYILATVHRETNVKNPHNLTAIMNGLIKSSIDVVFPLHPRTRKKLESLGILSRLKESRKIHFINPVGYYDFINLIRHARIVATDSGGVQCEAFWLKIPCITLRNKTEWTETIDLGANVLVGHNTKKIVKELKRTKIFPKINNQPYGNGDASKKIIKIIEDEMI